MSIVRVNTSKNYNIYIEKNFSRLSEAFHENNLTDIKLLCITDDNVSELYTENIKKILKPISAGFDILVFKHGENAKTLENTKEIYSRLMELSFERSSCIIALGGGVIGDLAGFAASTYMRGIKFVQLPTSLLSQVDSSVGGKVAVNLSETKNIIGSFYQPELVYINTKTLKSLPYEEFISGMGEIIKYGFIKDSEFLNYLDKNSEIIKQYNDENLSYIIEKSLRIKAEIVSSDEREMGVREILNFGHTFGHAVESLSGYSISHGKAVALGMVSALYLSKKYNAITDQQYKNALKIMRAYDLNLSIKNYHAKSLYNMALKDKKIKNSRLTLILLNSIGSAYSTRDISSEDILEAFEQITV